MKRTEVREHAAIVLENLLNSFSREEARRLLTECVRQLGSLSNVKSTRQMSLPGVDTE